MEEYNIRYRAFIKAGNVWKNNQELKKFIEAEYQLYGEEKARRCRWCGAEGMHFCPHPMFESLGVTFDQWLEEKYFGEGVTKNEREN